MTATDRELLASIEVNLQELRRRGVVRTNNAPVGDYAEALVRDVLGGTLEPNSGKSRDLVTDDGERIQVKARIVRNGSAPERQLSSFRSFDFDQLVVILFDAEYHVRRATMLPVQLVVECATTDSYVNARRVVASDALLDAGTDLTHLFQ
jgi:hypothetical protein